MESTKRLLPLAHLAFVAMARKLGLCANRLKTWLIPSSKFGIHLQFKATAAADIPLIMNVDTKPRMPVRAGVKEKLAAMEALEDAADIKAALKARKGKGEIPLEQIKAELGLTKPKQPGKSHRGSKRRAPAKTPKGRSRIRTDE